MTKKEFDLITALLYYIFAKLKRKSNLPVDNTMKSNKRNIMLAVILVIILGSTLSIIFFRPFQLTFVPLANQFWKQNPGLLAVYSNTPTSTLTVFRMKDGKEERLEGNWNTKFLKPNEMAIYGSFSADVTTSTLFQKKRLFLLTDRGGEIKDISKLPGDIYDIEQNPLGTYFLIFGMQENTKTKAMEPYACVVDKMRNKMIPCDEVLGKIFKKGTFDPLVQHKIFWDRTVDRKLVIQELGGKQQVSTFDPWEDSPLLLSEADKTTILSKNEAPIPSLEPEYNTSRWGSYILFKKHTGKPVLLAKVPKESITMWITPTMFVYSKEKDFYVINVEKKEESLLSYMPEGIYKMSVMNNTQQF